MKLNNGILTSSRRIHSMLGARIHTEQQLCLFKDVPADARGRRQLEQIGQQALVQTGDSLSPYLWGREKN